MKENIHILAKSIIFSFKISNKMWIIFGGKKNPTQKKPESYVIRSLRLQQLRMYVTM